LDVFDYFAFFKIIFWLQLGWYGGIGLEPVSVLLLKVSSSILFGVNLGGLSFFKKQILVAHYSVFFDL
jgi:hypothetical protein